jgi:hypothetical protein
VAAADVGGVQPGSRVSFQIESIGQQAFDGTVSAVRLQPLVEQAAASAATAGSAAPVPIGTSGASSTATAAAGQPAANARYRVDAHHRPLRPSLNPRSPRRAPARPLRVHHQAPRRPAAAES